MEDFFSVGQKGHIDQFQFQRFFLTLTSISIQLPFKIEFIHVLESHQIKSVSSRLMLYTKLYHSLWLNPYLLSFHDQKSKWSFVAIWVTFAPFLELSTPSSSANFLGSWHISGLKSKSYYLRNVDFLIKPNFMKKK